MVLAISRLIVPLGILVIFINLTVGSVVKLRNLSTFEEHQCDGNWKHVNGSSAECYLVVNTTNAQVAQAICKRQGATLMNGQILTNKSSETSLICKKPSVPVIDCPYAGKVDVSHLTDVIPNCADKYDPKPSLTLKRRGEQNVVFTYPDYLTQLDKIITDMGPKAWADFISKRLIFIAHGYHDDGSTGWITNSIEAILEREDANCIAVDWSGGAKSLLYFGSAGNTRVVGALLAKTIDHLVERGLPPSNIWGIGHSLGAHVVGFAGKLSSYIYGRLTGLDPAKPDFDIRPIIYRFNKLFAASSDSIHTGGNIYNIPIIDDFGTPNAVGDADFYANGGHDQPGCTYYDNVFKSCSHNRAFSLFVESIRRSDECLGGQFDNKTCTGVTSKFGYGWAGPGPQGGAKGSFYLVTANSSNYCLGHVGVTLEDTTSDKPVSIANCSVV